MTHTTAVLSIQDIEEALVTALQAIRPDKLQLLRLEMESGLDRATIKKYLRGDVTKLDNAAKIMAAWEKIAAGEPMHVGS